MTYSKETYNKLFELLAATRYNSERREILENLICRLLTEPINFDLKHEMQKISTDFVGHKRRKLPSENQDSVDKMNRMWFDQRAVLQRGIPEKELSDYILQKYFPYGTFFEAKHKCRWDTPMIFSLLFSDYLRNREYLSGFDGEVYQFESKEEYGDPGFVKIPDKYYKSSWRNVATIATDELAVYLRRGLGKHEIDFMFDLLSTDARLLDNCDKIDLISKPFLRLSNETIILLTPDYLLKNLPLIFDRLYLELKEFVNDKGNSFEKLVQKTLKSLPFKTLSFNRRYKDKRTQKVSDVDAIIEFDKTNYFVQIKSHPISVNALKGNPVAIENDLRRSVQSAIEQGIQSIKNLDHLTLSDFKRNGKQNKILVILDSIYPQLNPTTAATFFDKKIPAYVINWFDLKVITEQPEIRYFEQFAEWRRSDPMPIICFDERDYWGFYFDRYLTVPGMKEAFTISQKMQHRSFYISARFNDKTYLQKLVSSEQKKENRKK